MVFSNVTGNQLKCMRTVLAITQAPTDTEFDSRPLWLLLGWVTSLNGQTTSVFHQVTYALPTHHSASYPMGCSAAGE